jgi:hypothetical protein
LFFYESEREESTMPILRRPDPLGAGKIEGQNPATPERLPSHTADVSSVPAGDANEEELGGRPAFLFEAGDLAAVTLDSSGQNLPMSDGEPWRLVRYFTLGVRDAGLAGISPEPIIRGVHAHGYYLWDRTSPRGGEGTSQ